MLGLVPGQMEDKWFVYYEDGWLRFHRSWTGAFIYALCLDGSPAGVRVIDSWVNRNQQQYAGSDTDYDRKLVSFLIDAFLLKKAGISFPMPPKVGSAPKGVVQHSYVGRSCRTLCHSEMRFSVHILMQYTNDLDDSFSGLAVKNNVAPLREFSVSVTNVAATHS